MSKESQSNVRSPGPPDVGTVLLACGSAPGDESIKGPGLTAEGRFYPCCCSFAHSSGMN